MVGHLRHFLYDTAALIRTGRALLVLSVVVVALASLFFLLGRLGEKNFVEADGVVLSLSGHFVHSPPLAHPAQGTDPALFVTYEFQTRTGRTVKSTAEVDPVAFSRLRVGDPLRVLYKESEPSKSWLKNAAAPGGVLVWVIAAAVLAGIGTIFCVWSDVVEVMYRRKR